MNSYTYGRDESELLASVEDVSRYLGRSSLQLVDALHVQWIGRLQWSLVGMNDARFRTTTIGSGVSERRDTAESGNRTWECGVLGDHHSDVCLI